jgi:hypothetical protein
MASAAHVQTTSPLKDLNYDPPQENLDGDMVDERILHVERLCNALSGRYFDWTG